MDVPAEHEGAQSAEQQAAQETPSTARTPPEGHCRWLPGHETEELEEGLEEELGEELES